MERNRGFGVKAGMRSAVSMTARITACLPRLTTFAAVSGCTLTGLLGCGVAACVSGEQSLPQIHTPARELPNGAYRCMATNTTQGNGPYFVNCEKSAGMIRVHVRNGGSVETRIQSQQPAAGEMWQIEAVNVSTSDRWEVDIMP
jgi:hypothetical protein